jgi:hypothetical protein
MTKRQRRIKGVDLLSEAPKLIGEEASIVLKNNSVLFVKIIKVEDNSFVANDFILRKHKIDFSDITEVIQEYNA